MTVAGGAFLLSSLALMLAKIEIPFDPAWVTVAICGLPLAHAALARLVFEKRITSALLITIAMVAAIYIGELFAAGEVAFIMAIGSLLEDKTIQRAQRGVKNLINLAPKQGRLIRDGSDELVPVGQIEKGDVLRVLPGEAMPVDGEILSGSTSVDQSIVTGESLPVDKTVGDSVYCGTINRFGSVEIKAVKVGEDSSLQKLIHMVREAENKKAPTQRIVDKWAALLVPTALAIAIITFLVTGNITRAVTVLVVFCPCALALATPTSIMAAIGQATKFGVIIKSGEALERMGKVDTIAFDKTGTITHGKLVVSDVKSFDPSISDNELLLITASAEARSEHPIGRAIVSFAKEQGVETREAGDFGMIPGKGIRADIGGRRVLCGSLSYLEEDGVTPDVGEKDFVATLRDQGKATILVAMDGKTAGVIALSDTLRPAIEVMVRELEQMQTDAVLLTGDHARTAEYFARQAGIKSVHAGLLPAQKVERIDTLQREGRNVCMIGDGVNDAPALKTASVGVAMGGIGSDITMDAADVVLMGDDISRIPYLKRLSNTTISTIKFNITLSMLINFVAVGMSVMGMLTPVIGALVHNAGSVLVVLNATRLYDRKLK